MLLILSGASGSGKTTIAHAIAAMRPPRVAVHFLDSVGVPDDEEMVRRFGSGEAWQRAMTIEWMERLAPAARRGPVLLEGQMRLSFARQAVRANDLTDVTYLLVDCDDAVRRDRLAGRGQPELATADMMNWAAFLRREAAAILDTA